MKLSELVALKEGLKEHFDTSAIVKELNELAEKIKLLDRNVSEEYQASLNELVASFEDLSSQVKLKPFFIFNETIKKLNHSIEDKSLKFFADNYETENLTYHDPEAIRKHRVLDMPGDSYDIVLSRIGSYINWKYPALEIGCRDGEWTQHLVAGDPLYLVDSDPLFLSSAVSRFPIEYQRRVRPYLIKNIDFSALPKNQFGFVFSWNHMNYKGLESIKDYLKEIFKLLRPGGTFMFSYNNGDLPVGAIHAENYFMSYIPASMLLPMCEMVGYEISKTYDFKPALSWVELRKPGQLSTMKEHQTMGVIREINSI